MLVTDLRREASRTLMRRLDDVAATELDEAFAELEHEGAAALQAEGTPRERIEFVRQVDLRYVGQSYELTIPAGDELAARFHREHDRAYGFSAETEPIECVSLRLATVGRIAKPPLQRAAERAAARPKERREVYFAEAGGYVDCPIYDRYSLGRGATLDGPAVVEEFDSTCVVHPGYAAQVDEFGNLLLRPR
jgi:N-methylhydantoinase A